jgi:large subunit ribosomal protein L31
MKKGIHPEYHRCKVTCVTCGNTFETGSVLPEIRVDTCSKCHSFYTGKVGTVVSDGRIDRFQKKYAKAASAAKPEAK